MKPLRTDIVRNAQRKTHLQELVEWLNAAKQSASKQRIASVLARFEELRVSYQHPGYGMPISGLLLEAHLNSQAIRSRLTDELSYYQSVPQVGSWMSHPGGEVMYELSWSPAPSTAFSREVLENLKSLGERDWKFSEDYVITRFLWCLQSGTLGEIARCKCGTYIVLNKSNQRYCDKRSCYRSDYDRRPEQRERARSYMRNYRKQEAIRLKAALTVAKARELS